VKKADERCVETELRAYNVYLGEKSDMSLEKTA
jgi:hypothetical protein